MKWETIKISPKHWELSIGDVVEYKINAGEIFREGVLCVRITTFDGRIINGVAYEVGERVVFPKQIIVHRNTTKAEIRRILNRKTVNIE